MLNLIVWNRTVYSYEMDLVSNNLQRLICHKTQTNKQKLHTESQESPTQIETQNTGNRMTTDSSMTTLMLT